MRPAWTVLVVIVAVWRSPAAVAVPRVTSLVDNAGRVESLTTTPNGQTAYCLDIDSGGITAIDPFVAERRRDVVRPAAHREARPVAIAALPGDVIGAVCRQDDDWMLRTFRVRPEPVVEAADEVRLGQAAGTAARVCVVASASRDWLAISGLPPPLPSLWRGVCAAAGVRPLPAAGGRTAELAGPVVAIAVSPSDQLAVFTAEDGESAELSYRAAAGRELLRLNTGLAGIRAAAFTRDDGCLWVLAAPPAATGQPAGLWRIDATFRDGLQGARPVCVVELDGPQALAAVSSHSLLAVIGQQERSVVRIDVVEEEHP